jgi:transcriptional regulator with XRE-family HTH domain
MRQRRSLLGMS